jgi:DNA-binding NarL/FixJ family response regulator
MVGRSSYVGTSYPRVSEPPNGNAGAVNGSAPRPAGRGQRVLVIDNNLLTAQTVVVALSQLDFSARFALPTTPEHVRELGTWQPDVAVLDIDSVKSIAALACIRALRTAGVPVAVVTGDLDAPLASESLHAGAISVVHKGAPLDELVEILLRIVDGGDVLTDQVRRRLMERPRRLAPFEVLTYREKFVLSQIMEGQCAEAIASGSCVSISTVRSQIKAILQKLGVNSQLAAASMARQVGWTFAGAQDPGVGAVESGTATA